MAMKVQTILATKGTQVVTIRPALTLREAVVVLAQHNIGALPVLADDGTLVGIVSERDVIQQIARDPAILDAPVSVVMTRDVVVGSPQDELVAVLQTMDTRRFRHLPIVEQGRLVGVVSIGDLVKAQLDSYRGQLDTLETQLLDG
jgi:CBS domain-containing protein